MIIHLDKRYFFVEIDFLENVKFYGTMYGKVAHLEFFIKESVGEKTDEVIGRIKERFYRPSVDYLQVGPRIVVDYKVPTRIKNFDAWIRKIIESLEMSIDKFIDIYRNLD